MLSTRPEKSVGTDDIWNLATEALKGALGRKGWDYKVTLHSSAIAVVCSHKRGERHRIALAKGRDGRGSPHSVAAGVAIAFVLQSVWQAFSVTPGSARFITFQSSTPALRSQKPTPAALSSVWMNKLVVIARHSSCACGPK